MLRKYIFLVLIGSLFLSGCGDLSSSQQKEVKEALQSLGKITSSIEIGVSFGQYSSLVLEANFQVNEAVNTLSKSPLKDELASAMEAYVDARDAWSYDLASEYHTYLAEDKEPGLKLIPKYSLHQHVKSKDAVQIIWHKARKHLDKANKLLE